MLQRERQTRRHITVLVGLAAAMAAAAPTMTRWSNDKWWAGYDDGPDNGRNVSSRQIEKSNAPRLAPAIRLDEHADRLKALSQRGARP